MGRPDEQIHKMSLRSSSLTIRGQQLKLPDSSFHNSESSFDVRETKVLQVASLSPKVEKSVRFCSGVESHEITHKLDMDKNERTLIWYRTSDYKRIRNERQETVKMIRNGDLLQDNDIQCFLGLDSETHSYAHQHSLHNLMVQDLVSGEQARQRVCGINDPEFLAEEIRDLNSRCRHAAFVAGLRADRTERRGIIN
jgi:hypothetical protein